MKKIRIGVFGAGRGSSMINYCKAADHAQLAAICDKWEEGLRRHKERSPEMDIAYYTDFDEFIRHDMDAVILANYANEHAPFAIQAMKAGKHVFSEVLPVQTMKEAVELIETVEETGMTYAYGENYCYMSAPYEMRRLYREGAIGEFEYGEGEYVHNCEPIWPGITYGERDHWRNNMYSTFYCTHSIGPLIHMTGLRPVSVTGFEGHKNERGLRKGSKGGAFGMEMITLENGGIINSIHGYLYRNSVWYCAYGSKGSMESAREGASPDGVERIYVHADSFSGAYDDAVRQDYIPVRQMEGSGKDFGHGGSDFYTMYNFIEKLLGNEDADIIDVYEALDMFLPGMFAYRSILKGGIPMEIPDLRDPAVRELYRNDTACTDSKAAGDMLLPTMSTGTPEIDDAVYTLMREKWLEDLQSDHGYTAATFSQSSKKEE